MSGCAENARENGGEGNSRPDSRLRGFFFLLLGPESIFLERLVEGDLRDERLDEPKQKLTSEAFVDLRPFGPTLSHSLRNARWRPDGTVVWEEEDYCFPPLAQERDAVLDDYFWSVEVEPVAEGDGWARIRDLPRLFPNLADELPA